MLFLCCRELLHLIPLVVQGNWEIVLSLSPARLELSLPCGKQKCSRVS